MTGLAPLRKAGFRLRAVEDGKIYIEPINELSEAQRQWITSNKPEIRQQLLLERWQWFFSLSAEHGIHSDVVAAEFPTEDDRLDVIEPTEHDDITLRLCMATLCQDIRVIRRQQNYEAGMWVPVDTDGNVVA